MGETSEEANREPTHELAIRRAIGFARALDRTDVVADAEALAERVEQGRFFVACVGQFKRGKSTLLNALVGKTILPVGVVPVTSTVTVMRFGEEEHVRVRFDSGQVRAIPLADLAELVTERENPANEKGVLAGDVEHPRDRTRLRSLRLAYHEVTVPPLHGRQMSSLLTTALARSSRSHLLHDEDRRLLLHAAAGRPGWIDDLLHHLDQDRYWRTGHVQLVPLVADVHLKRVARVFKRYAVEGSPI
jgi:hypothetical protein